MYDLAQHNPYGLRLRTPAMAAAGCLGYGVEYAHSIERMQAGAIVTRSTSLYAQRQSQPRLDETPAGLLMSGTWHNPGIEAVLRKYAPIWAGWETPVILSIVGANAEEYATLAGALEGVEGIAGIELQLAALTEQAARITAAVRAATQLPLLAKLPQHPTIERLCLDVAAAGADALTLFAPQRAAIASADDASVSAGWLLGPATRPLVLAGLAGLAARLPIPVVACGGVASADDARAMLAAGAAAVQVGSALLAAPDALGEIGAALANG